MIRLRSHLERAPLTSAIIYTVLGVLPLYLMSAQSVLIQQDLDFGPSRFGIVVSSFFLVSSIASRAVGPWIDRNGPTPGLRLASLITASVAVLAFTVVSGWLSLALVMGLSGLGNAIAQLSSNAVIAGHVAKGRHGISISAKQAAVPLAAVLGGALVPLVGLSEWRPAFTTTLVAGIVLAVVCPRLPAHRPVATSPGGAGSATGSDTETETDSASGPATPPIIRRWAPEVVTLMGAGACAGGIGNGLASFTPHAAVTAGFSPSVAALLLTAGSFVAIVARIGGGWSADRRRRSGYLETVTLLAFGVVGLIGLSLASNSRALFLASLLLTFAGAWGWPGVIMLLALRTLRLPAATATGTVAAGSYFGTVVVPILMGIVIEERSYAAVFAGQAVLLTCSILLVSASVAISTRRDAAA
jgi:MFS family permease